MPKITEVDVPVSLPDGRVVGKARVVEGDGEDAVLIELESKDPIVAAFIKEQLVGIAIHYIPQPSPTIHQEPDCAPDNANCKYPEPHHHGFACDKTCRDCQGQCHIDCPANFEHYGRVKNG